MSSTPPLPPAGSEIPKIIMQTWKTHDVPDKWKRSPQSIQDVMVPTGWQYVLLSDEDCDTFVQQHFPQYLDAFRNLPYSIQRADMIRPMWLYVNGGVYMDLDFVVRKPLDPLFEGTGNLFFTRSTSVDTHLTNSLMASVPGHPFWLLYLERMVKPKRWWALGKHTTVMTTTGPYALTETLRKSPYPYTVLPDTVIPCGTYDEHCKKDGYIETLEGKSWNDWDSILLNWLYVNWKPLVMLLVLFILYVFWKIGEVSCRAG